MCRTNMARLTPLGLLNTSRAIRGGLISNTIYWLECCNISSTLPSSQLLSRDQITLSLSSWSSSLRGTHLTTLHLTSSSTVVLQSGLVRRDVAPPWRSSWDICPSAVWGRHVTWPTLATQSTHHCPGHSPHLTSVPPALGNTNTEAETNLWAAVMFLSEWGQTRAMNGLTTHLTSP